jgi:hypothetical protein
MICHSFVAGELGDLDNGWVDDFVEGGIFIFILVSSFIPVCFMLILQVLEAFEELLDFNLYQ